MSEFASTALRTAAPALVALKDALRCLICYDTIGAPVSLPCGHSFCSLCIRNNITFKIKQHVNATCPTCREPCDEASLRSNIDLRAAVAALEQLLPQLEQLSSSQQELVTQIISLKQQQAIGRVAYSDGVTSGKPSQRTAEPATVHVHKRQRSQDLSPAARPAVARVTRARSAPAGGLGSLAAGLNPSTAPPGCTTRQAAALASVQQHVSTVGPCQVKQLPPAAYCDANSDIICISASMSTSDDDGDGDDNDLASQPGCVNHDSPAAPCSTSKRQCVGTTPSAPGRERARLTARSKEPAPVSRHGDLTHPPRALSPALPPGKAVCPVCRALVSSNPVILEAHVNRCLDCFSSGEQVGLAPPAGKGCGSSPPLLPAGPVPASVQGRPAGTRLHKITVPQKMVMHLLKDAQLKHKLQASGLPVDGKRQDLIDRYLAYRSHIMAHMDKGCPGNLSQRQLLQNFLDEQRRLAQATLAAPRLITQPGGAACAHAAASYKELIEQTKQRVAQAKAAAASDAPAGLGPGAARGEDSVATAAVAVQSAATQAACAITALSGRVAAVAQSAVGMAGQPLAAVPVVVARSPVQQSSQQPCIRHGALLPQFASNGSRDTAAIYASPPGGGVALSPSAVAAEREAEAARGTSEVPLVAPEVASSSDCGSGQGGKCWRDEADCSEATVRGEEVRGQLESYDERVQAGGAKNLGCSGQGDG